MKTLINMVMASVLVLGSSHVNATEVDLDMTDMLTKTVKVYVSQATNEVKKSVKDAVYLDAQAIFAGLLETTSAAEHDDIYKKQLVVKIQQNNKSNKK